MSLAASPASVASGASRMGAAAAVLTLGAGAAMAYELATFRYGSPAAAAIGAAALAMAAYGFTRRSLLIQVASRGAAFLVCTPLLVATIARIGSGAAPHVAPLAALVSLAAALALSRPMLSTDEAQRAFAPKRFRGLFLAGATAMTSVAIGAAAFAMAGLAWHSPIQVAFNGSLAAILIVAVRALLSMRAWGLLLGGLTSVVLLALTPFYGALSAVTLSLAAAPALLFWVIPLLVAWLRPQPIEADGSRIDLRTTTEASGVARRRVEDQHDDEELEDDVSESCHVSTCTSARSSTWHGP